MVHDVSPVCNYQVVNFEIFLCSYMPPQYFSQNHSVDAKDDNKRRKNLLTLVRFAASMMTRLQGVNKDAFQEFQLRVGEFLK